MTAKSKYFGSIGVIVVLLSALWFFGIRKTLAVKSDLAHNQILKQRIDNADRLIGSYSKTIEQYGESQDTALVYSEDMLFSHIERVVARNKGTILQYLPQQDKMLDNAKIKTKKIQVKGAYYDLVRCLHEIEANPNKTKVLSSKLEMINNRKTRRTYLVLEMYVQNVIMI